MEFLFVRFWENLFRGIWDRCFQSDISPLYMIFFISVFSLPFWLVIFALWVLLVVILVRVLFVSIGSLCLSGFLLSLDFLFVVWLVF